MGSSTLINHLQPRKSILFTGNLGVSPWGTTCHLHQDWGISEQGRSPETATTGLAPHSVPSEAP